MWGWRFCAVAEVVAFLVYAVAVVAVAFVLHWWRWRWGNFFRVLVGMAMAFFFSGGGPGSYRENMPSIDSLLGPEIVQCW